MPKNTGVTTYSVTATNCVSLYSLRYPLTKTVLTITYLEEHSLHMFMAKKLGINALTCLQEYMMQNSGYR